jgi:hypothetical protein
MHGSVHPIKTTLPLGEMSRSEKVMAMEALWEDLSRDEAQVETPEWHLKELAATEARVKAGVETFLDWEQAKKDLRRRFE